MIKDDNKTLFTSRSNFIDSIKYYIKSHLNRQENYINSIYEKHDIKLDAKIKIDIDDFVIELIMNGVISFLVLNNLLKEDIYVNFKD